MNTRNESETAAGVFTKERRALPADVLARRIRDLLRVELFASLDERAIAELAESVWERRCAQGEVVVRADEAPGTHLFLVAEGELAVSIESEAGKESVLALLGQGEFFGEMSLFGEDARAATVKATADTRLLMFRREEFLARLKSSPALMGSLIEALIRRIRAGNRRVAGISRRRVETRIAEALVSLLDERGKRLRDDTGPTVVIPNRPTQQFLADIAGTTRETVSRALAEWRRQGLLAVKGRDWLVKEEDRLRALAA